MKNNSLFLGLLIYMLCCGQVIAQTGVVSGTVSSADDGSMLVGVNIVVKNTDTGTTTNENGAFVLEGVSANDVLVLSYIGYETAEVAVSGRAIIEVTLVSTVIAGEDVVVIGYGTQSRRDVTGAISSLKEGSFTKGTNTDLQSLLQARAPGVVITANNGDIGSEPRIRIRGGTSINASNNPIIVIDGVPLNNSSALPGGFTTGAGAGADGTMDNPLGMLNPDDIASIDILKDAASSAIYGARGGNGVILITTKEGRPGELSLTYSASTSSSSITKKLDLMDAAGFKSYASSIGVDIEDGGANTDWQDEILRSAVSTNHNISFSAGTQQTQYRASISYLDQQGILLNSERQRISTRLNVRHTMLDNKLKLGLKVSPSFSNRNNTPYNQRAGYFGGVFTNVLKFNPTYPVKNTDGSYYEYATTTIRNPVALLNEISDVGENLRVLTSATAEYELISGLNAKVTLGLDRESYNRNIYEPNSLPYAASIGGQASVQNTQRKNDHFNTTLNYSNSSMNVLAGYEFQEFTNSGFGATTKGFVTDAWLYNNMGGATDFTTAPYSFKNQNRLVSFFGRVAYSMGGKLNVMATLRREGSSRFGDDNKWGVFPSASVGFRVTDDIKLRASYGVAGNQEIGNYRSLVTLGSGANAVIGGQLLSGVAANQLANPDLKWETTSDINFGVDFALMDNKITGSVDMYSKTTEDMLVEVNVPQPAVVTTKLDNVGSVENSGLEFFINSVNMSTKDMSWNTSFNFSTNKNNVVSLGKDVEYIVTGQVGGAGLSGVQAAIIKPGEPFGTFFGYELSGYDADGQEILSTDGGPLGDGRRILGSPHPDYTFGMTNQINFGNIDFSFYIWSVQGNEILNNTRLEYQRPSNPFNNINLFSETADDVNNGLGSEAAVALTDKFIEDGSFIRLQNVTIGYTLKTGQFKNLRFYLSADNLITLTDYSGFDPEVSTISGLAEGIDYTNYPKAKTISFGINVGL
ncbi:MAG TPA: SusC/RagA family TonB-linked outer membrane protein [Candidatus Marinimicrobia bacterium]|jgi:iron complex outermembrane receptor protein|nr:SusC/RagA family TonB-linked outer membrane protein [Candidatus Neomarinimicrobiota bacterium]